MHLLRAQPGQIVDGDEAVDLGQTPADIVFLSAADTELALLAAARAAQTDDDAPSLRLANWMQLKHPMSVDVYVDTVIANAALVIVRLLGGSAYWSYGVEQIHAVCRERNIKLALLPGDDQPDEALASLCLLPPAEVYRLWQYCVHGGADNAAELLNFSADLLGRSRPWREPKPLLRAGLYWPGLDVADLDDLRAAGHWRNGRPGAALVFYRALLAADDLAPIDALIDALTRRGFNPLPLYASSLKDAVAAATLTRFIDDGAVAVVLNTTGFSLAMPGAERAATPFDQADCVVLQVVLSGAAEAVWRADSQGLSAQQIAMNVALPEVDGRVLSRAVAFKTEARLDPLTEWSLVRYRPLPDRVEFVAELAERWQRLRAKPPPQRRLALLFANYPHRDGRLGNGVGLDTPAAAVLILRALRERGYRVDAAETLLAADGAALIGRLAAGPTNALAGRAARPGGVRFPVASYRAFFTALPEPTRDALRRRWGEPETDPFVDGDDFVLAAFTLGNVVIGLQPARGYHIDPAESYHDPDLVPPHGYLAFYAWLRGEFAADAVVHLGKHGNLEWLPGKALALSERCYPEAALGALPHLYPFIVNDPGEGSQAKRRAQAVIIDHLTPPLTRADSYGDLAELELLADEYFDAAGSDPRRLGLLRDRILDKLALTGLDQDCGIKASDDADSALGKLDGYLCDLKELQIRDGLHVFGRSPDGELLTALLVALTRLDRGDGRGGNRSLIRALAEDLRLGDDFDPLDCDFAAPWTGPRPAALCEIAGGQRWRHHGDTVERLELLAYRLVDADRQNAAAVADWPATTAVLTEIERRLRPAVAGCGGAEIDALLRGLDGRFVAPGPSGAPTRGRPEVLPTGRNFYSVDTRTVPTAAAYTLGWKSASLLLDYHRQQHGEWPERLALSVWGTATMRTGGDDIAQALALLGVRPRWDVGSGRVSGFEVLPLELLDRPRIDVTLRVSGFFRDAFPAQIALFDSAVRAVAKLDEPAALNPLAARVNADARQLAAAGCSDAEAEQRAGFRVFGAKPGAYGAGLQALIDERGWRDDADLAEAFLAWGGYAYGDGVSGAPAQSLFKARLGAVDAVVHNQDNREHDLLDSDDYYQFEGGMTAAVRHYSGRQPAVYHNDHARPESPKIRTLEQEIGRVVRGRVVNPKWIAGAMRHGYKGGFELAATVDYLFAFAATARVVKDHHFDAVYDAYLQDQRVLTFLREHNPAALREIAERLQEALSRGLWRARSNSVHDELAALAT